MMLNQQPRTLNLTRKEICDIRLALTIIDNKNPGNTRWSKLLNKVIEQFDAQEPEEYRQHKEA